MTAAVSICPTPILQVFNNAGQPNAGGSILTQVGGVNYVTYQDQGVTPLPNPIPLNSRGEVSSAAGQSQQLFLVQNVVYTFTIYDVNGNQIDQAQYVAGAATPTQSSIGLTLWPQTASELAHSITPTYYYYPPGNILRYGADPLGAADSTAAINNALISNTRVYAPGGIYLISATLNVQSDQIFYGDGSSSVILSATGSVINFTLSGVTRALLRDFMINITGTGFIGETAGIYLLNSSYCVIESVEMAGCNWSGVWLDAASNYNTIRKCYFHGFSEPAGSGGDIRVYSAHGGGTTAPSYNIIEDNVCYGGGGMGIGIEDPDSATIAAGFPSHNLVQGNRVGAHLTYGILNYMPGNSAPSTNTGNQIIGNYVENISGLCPTNNSSGAGIYQVGVGGGATQIIGNEIVNCCINTMNRSLAPAGIGIAGFPTGIVPPIVTDNTITGMTQGDGILIVSCAGGALVKGNSITVPSSNNGTGPGGSTMQGNGLRIEASSYVTAEANQVWAYGPGSACFVYANGINAVGVSLNGGSYGVAATGTGNGLQTTQAGGFDVTQFAVTGARFPVLAGTSAAVNISAIVAGYLTNVVANAQSGNGLMVSAAAGLFVTGGEFSTTGSVAIATSGSCPGSFIDNSVSWGTTASLMSNSATGLRVNWFSTASPAGGIWAVGDTVYNTTPTAAGVFLWTCTTAGAAPGTSVFKTVSNT